MNEKIRQPKVEQRYLKRQHSIDLENNRALLRAGQQVKELSSNE